jgi:hypothetical protein
VSSPRPAPGYVAREQLAEAFRALGSDELVHKLRAGGLTPLAVEVATTELAARGIDPASHVFSPDFEARATAPQAATPGDRVGNLLLGLIKVLGAAGASLALVGAAFWEFGEHGGGSGAGYLFALLVIFGLLLTQRIPIVGLVLAGACVLFFYSCAANFHWAGG